MPDIPSSEPASGDTLGHATAALFAALERADPSASVRDGWPELAREAEKDLRSLTGQEQYKNHALAAADAVAELLAEPSEFAAAWATAADRYQALVKVVPGHHPSLKPQNLWRNIWHVSNGTSAVLLYEVVDHRWTMVAIAASLLLLFLGIDVARRVWPRINPLLVNGPLRFVLRPQDSHATPSSTWFTVGLLIGTALFSKTAVQIAALVLAFADPAAGYIGKKWGRLVLIRGRTAIGSTAFIVVAAAIAWAWLWVAGMGHRWDVALVVAVAGAVAELGSGRIDDNLTIPLIAGGAAALMLG